MSWSREYIKSEVPRKAAVDFNPPNPAREATETNSATFQINNVKLYVLVVTLSIKDNIKFFENIKQEFKIKTSWNKYRTEITSNNLDYPIDPKFSNINRLFVLLFKNGNDDFMGPSFNKYYMQKTSN